MRQPPPPVAQIGRKAFRQMSDTELLAWVARVYADWRELPTALLELSDRHVHYRAIERSTALPRSTAHALVQRHKERGSASAGSPPDPTATSSMSS